MSTLLSEEDLNDFISPALACTKPTTITTESDGLDSNGEVVVGKEAEQAQKVSITLSDCLACSGCITSSEEIMLQRQSHTVFLDAMKEEECDKDLAVSISPQCRVNMAMYYGITVQEFDLCFIKFWQTVFHAKYVMGLQIGRNISIQQSIKAVEEWKSLLNDGEEGDNRPRLSAIDPGFVIYTEKTKGELVPLLVNVKSPQQIIGNLLKREHPNTYHLCIMACFDKKLEASRPDSEGEVDCVITPKEFLSMLEDINEMDFLKYKNNDSKLYEEVSPMGWDSLVNWSCNEGSPSGGWAYQYIQSIQRDHPESELIKIAGKNNNITEYRLIDSQGDKIASSTELSGFRNIQNLVRHLGQVKRHPKRRIQVLKKRGATSIKDTKEDKDKIVAEPYKSDYIEVSASPGGCINGGGLINNEVGKTQRKEYTAKLQSEYFQCLNMIDPLQYNSDLINEPFKYEFHAVETSKDIVTVGNKW